MRAITVAASAPCAASPRRTDLRPLRKYPAVASDLTLLKFRLLRRLTKCLVLHTHRRPDPKSPGMEIINYNTHATKVQPRIVSPTLVSTPCSLTLPSSPPRTPAAPPAV